jgi:F-type H+-transporting ATPase subunit b
MRRSVLLALPIMLSAASVRADDSGLPQFDPALFPEQIFWLAISFATLYALMSKIALPRVARTQENRKKVITAELEAAREANDTAKASLAAVEKSLSEARAKAHAHVNEMLSNVVSEAATHQAAQEKEMQRRLHRAEADIAVTREAALTSIRASADDLAAAVVEKILGLKQRAES